MRNKSHDNGGTIHERLLANGNLIPLADLQKWIREIMRHCGGLRPAARTIGVPHSVLHRWTWKGDRAQLVRVRKHNAEKIMNTVVGIRNGTIKPDHKHRPGPKKGM